APGAIDRLADGAVAVPERGIEGRRVRARGGARREAQDEDASPGLAHGPGDGTIRASAKQANSLSERVCCTEQISSIEPTGSDQMGGSSRGTVWTSGSGATVTGAQANGRSGPLGSLAGSAGALRPHSE